jgi:hypothetical protein
MKKSNLAIVGAALLPVLAHAEEAAKQATKVAAPLILKGLFLAEFRSKLTLKRQTVN